MKSKKTRSTALSQAGHHHMVVCLCVQSDFTVFGARLFASPVSLQKIVIYRLGHGDPRMLRPVICINAFGWCARIQEGVDSGLAGYGRSVSRPPKYRSLGLIPYHLSPAGGLLFACDDDLSLSDKLYLLHVCDRPDVFCENRDQRTSYVRRTGGASTHHAQILCRGWARLKMTSKRSLIVSSISCPRIKPVEKPTPSARVPFDEPDPDRGVGWDDIGLPATATRPTDMKELIHISGLSSCISTSEKDSGPRTS